ncbi:MAG: FHA domain-containing protein, partial [Chloroflexia bacterium]
MEKQEQPLLVVHDKVSGQQWECPMTAESLVIGREETCGLVLPDRQVSRHHARIFREGGRYYLRDEGSRNGTFLNGSLVSGVRLLQDGDEIGIAARYSILFIGSESTAPLYRSGPTRRGIYLDRASHRVWVDGVEVVPPLSAAQYRLLELLCDRAGAICTRDEIVATVWPEEASEGITDQAIDAVV